MLNIQVLLDVERDQQRMKHRAILKIGKILSSLPKGMDVNVIEVIQQHLRDESEQPLAT